MSAAIIIIGIAVLKVALEVASVIAIKREEEAEVSARKPVPVETRGALPGEALAPLPSSDSVKGNTITTAYKSAASLDPKDVFDPAEFLVVAQRRLTPQRDLFDRSPASNLDTLNIPDDADEWLCAETDFGSLGIEDELYARTDVDYAVDMFHD